MGDVGEVEGSDTVGGEVFEDLGEEGVSVGFRPENIEIVGNFVTAGKTGNRAVFEKGQEGVLVVVDKQGAALA